MRKTVLLPLFTFLFLCTSAQEQGLPIIKNYTFKDVVYSPQVFSALQDNRGIMYFGVTNLGVLEYDGVNWRVIPKDLKSEVFGLAKDKQGRIYLSGTNDFGVLRENESGKMVYKSLKFLIDDSLSNISNVWNVHVIDDDVYFFTEKCLYLYSINKKSIRYVKPDPGNSFYVPFVFRNIYYILCSSNGIVRLSEKGLVPVPNSKFFSENIFLSAQPYDSSSILVPTRTAGLYIFDLKGTSNPVPFKLKPSEKFIENNNLYTSSKIGDKFIIGSMRKGAIIIDREGQIIRELSENQQLTDNLILSTISDISDNIWLSMSNGISKSELSQDITYWNKTCGLVGLINDITRFENRIYLVTNQSVYLLNNDNSSSKKVIPVKGIPPGQNWCLYTCTLPGTNKEVLLSGTQSGIYEISGESAKQIYTGTLHSFAIHQSQKNPQRIFSTDGFTDFISLVYTNGEWKSEGKWSGINEDIRSIVEDNNGDLWLGTFTNGVIRVEVNEDDINNPRKVEYFRTAEGLPVLSRCRPFLFDNKIVVGTEKGLYYLDPTSNRFVPFSLLGNQFCDGTIGIEHLIKMPDGKIYISSSSIKTGQVGILTPQNNGQYSWSYKPFRRLPEYSIISAFHADSDGVTWIGGNEGLYRYDPKQDIKNYDLDFSCLIREVLIGKDSTIYWGNKKLNPSVFVINYKYNNPTFKFSAPFFDNEEQTLYSYFLKGYDNNWSDWSTQTSKEYSRLLEGTYTFSVKALNIYGKESSVDEFQIKILPPWYRTVWAYMAYVLLSFLFYYTLMQIYSRVLIRQKQRLEKAVLERTLEIRQQKEALQSQAEEMAAQSEELQEQAEALSRINEELEKLSIVARETDNAIIIMDSTGKLLWINDGFSRLYGFSLDELLTKFSNIFDLDFSSSNKELIKRCIERKETVVFDSTNKTKNGKLVHVQTTITPVTDSFGNVQKLVAIESDISKLKEAEKEITLQKEELLRHRNHLEEIVKERTADLEIAKNKAEESDRLKSAFLANMSHEIRTPMNAIIGFSALLSNPDLTDEEKEEFINLINLNGSALLQLIEDIIDIAKIEAGQMSIEKNSCDIEEILKSIYNNYLNKNKHYYKKELDFKLKVESLDNKLFINTDSRRLRQILSNLLDNAFKFTDSGTIELGYTILRDSKSPKIRFYVKDTGIGMTSDEQKLLFNRFTKIENNPSKLYRGAGLGLAICKSLVTLLDGEIGVESELNAGTRFFFFLPLDEQIKTMETIKTASNSTRVQNYDWHGRTVLIAEDEESNYKYIEALLKKTQIQILRANNGLQAVNLFKTNKIDIVLMDIKMPEMNGMEATREIKKINPLVPVIALTAYAMQNDEQRCLDAGCDSYIAKPIMQDKFFALVSKYI